MKTRRLITLLLLVITYHLTVGQTTENVLNIISLKDTYKSSETISFSIISISEKNIYLTIGLEEFYNNEWVQITNDITKEDFSKSTQVMSIDSKGNLKIDWNPEKMPLVTLPEDDNKDSKPMIVGKYRFSIKWNENSYDSLNRIFISNSFELK